MVTWFPTSPCLLYVSVSIALSALPVVAKSLVAVMFVIVSSNCDSLILSNKFNIVNFVAVFIGCSVSDGLPNIFALFLKYIFVPFIEIHELCVGFDVHVIVAVAAAVVSE